MYESNQTPQQDKQRIDLAITLIAIGRDNHRHIVFGDKRTLEYLRDKLPNIKNTFTKRLANFMTKKSTLVKIKRMFFVNVVWDESYNTITRTNLNINLKNCPNDKFDFFLNQTILLLENNNDYKFYYKPIALKYVENTKINQNSKSITLDCQQKQTGGSAVESAIEAEIIEMSHFIFGIADSDKEYGIIPSTGKEYTTPNSKTCKQFEKMLGKLFEAEKINNFLYDCEVLNVRDIENLISMDMLLPYGTARNGLKRKIDVIRNYIHNDETKEENFYKFFDFECGIKVGNNDVTQFWTEIFNITDLALPIEGICSKDDMKLFFSNNLTVQSGYERLPQILKNEWDKIGQLIFSRCCAYKDKNKNT